MLPPNDQRVPKNSKLGEIEPREKRPPGCLGYIYRHYIGDYTTLLYGEYHTPLKGSLLNNQDSMESKAGCFFVSHMMISQVIQLVNF